MSFFFCHQFVHIFYVKILKSISIGLTLNSGRMKKPQFNFLVENCLGHRLACIKCKDIVRHNFTSKVEVLWVLNTVAEVVLRKEVLVSCQSFLGIISQHNCVSSNFCTYFRWTFCWHIYENSDKRKMANFRHRCVAKTLLDIKIDKRYMSLAVRW